MIGTVLVLSPSSLSAQVLAESYAILLRQLDGRVSFETLPRRPEPGFSFDSAMRFHGVWLGERLVGQSVEGAPNDTIRGMPDLPLAVTPGKPGQNQSVAWHRGFGSNALLPVGPGGFSDRGGRGEGAVTILFDRDQAAFGLRVHADYADPLGNRLPPGILQMALYSRQGVLIARTQHQLGYGVTEIGLRRDGGTPDIAAVVITNTDPGGIAIDDIVFQLTALTG